MTEMLGTYMKVALTAGVVLAMPFLLFQILCFIFPALTSQEKKYVSILLPWIGLMFAGGVVFGYFILLPPAIKFLLNFGSDIATPEIRIGSYITVVTRVLLAIGIVFELPVISTFLARTGIITSSWLASKRKYAIIFSFVLAAVVTPTSDPVNQSIVAIPVIILFEISIWLARLVQRKQLASTSIPVR
jgi:sec-independent protein translocase protein TatC